MLFARVCPTHVRTWHIPASAQQHTTLACSATTPTTNTPMESGMLQHDDGRKVAYDRLPPTTGRRKASEIRSLATCLGCETVLFDYQAHGLSPGNFTSLGPEDWLCDAQLVMDKLITTHKVVVVGSSLGGWIALLLARSRPERIHGLVLIAPAVDISESHWAGFTPQLKHACLETGLVPLHSPYVSTAPATVNTNEAPPEASMISTYASATTSDVSPTMVSQSAGVVMLGLPFFSQGSRLLLLQEQSLFAEEYESWIKHSGYRINRLSDAVTENSAVSSGQAVGQGIRELFANVPVCIMHGEADDCVPLDVSIRLMQSMCARPGGDDTFPTLDILVPTLELTDAPAVRAGTQFQVASDVVIGPWAVSGMCVASEDGDACRAIVIKPALDSRPHELLLVRAADHRLSSPAELCLLRQRIDFLLRSNPSSA